MRAVIAVGLFVSTTVLANAQPLVSEHERLSRALIAELAEQGFVIDGKRLTLEVRDTHACEEDVDRQQDLFHRTNYFMGQVGLLNALIEEDTELSESQARQAAVKDVLHSVAAYYQWDREALVFPRNALNRAVEGMGNREGLIAHELAHAVQAQRKGGLDALLQREPRWGDQVAAAHCLLEGEAELIAMKVLLARKQLDLDSVTEAHLLQQAALESKLAGAGSVRYDVGRRVLLRTYKRARWEGVRALVNAPPSSTEQLLHAGKLGSDTPTPVPPQTLAGWTELHRDVVGELQLSVYLRKLNVTHARRAACGWDGDCLQVFRNERRERLVVWRSVWDSDLDAQQFIEAIPAKRRAQRSGRWVDLVWSTGPGTAREVRAELAAPPELAPVAADEASTREAERQLALRAAQTQSTLEGDRWVIPPAKAVLRIPVGWTTQEDNATWVVFSPRTPGSSFRDNLNVQVQPNPLGTDLEAHVKANREQMESLPDIELTSIEASEAAGRPAVKCSFRGQVNHQKLEFECWIFPREHNQVVVTTTVLGVRDAKLKQTFAKILRSLEFQE